ncbi:MAG: DUF2442 domain-containing protein [Proteobacteria bacterium]|nr:DUF2442 domain-containing protein [Pseudomonadota bacterium]
MSTSQANQPRARTVEFSNDSLIVHLQDGRSLSVPLEWFPALRDASPEQLAQYRLVGRGIGIHWEALDEDLSVQALLTQTQPVARAG